MNLSFQEFLFSIMQFSIRKKILKKINSKTGFQNRKPVFDLKTENRISGFRLTSLIIISLFCNQKKYKRIKRLSAIALRVFKHVLVPQTSPFILKSSILITVIHD